MTFFCECGKKGAAGIKQHQLKPLVENQLQQGHQQKSKLKKQKFKKSLHLRCE